jgi:hypothetical protein
MHNNINSTHRLIATLEPVRELLRHVEDDAAPDLRELVLEVRLNLDLEIENLRRNG